MNHEVSGGLGAVKVAATLRLTHTAPMFVEGGFGIILREAIQRLAKRDYVSLRRTPPPGRRVIYDEDFKRHIAACRTVQRTIYRCTRHTTRGLHNRHRFYERVTIFIGASPFTMGRPCCNGVTDRGLLVPARSARSVVTTTIETLSEV